MVIEAIPRSSKLIATDTNAVRGQLDVVEAGGQFDKGIVATCLNLLDDIADDLGQVGGPAGSRVAPGLRSSAIMPAGAS